jgi:glycosyltransferase involved in cell wall biosynthesis
MPVFNERWTVGDVLQKIAATSFPIEREIIVVDDGSTDGSAELVARMAATIPGIRLIRQSSNGGKGSAIRRAIEEMTGDVAVIQDADLEYSPSDLPALLEPVLADQADAVFGSRFAGETRRSLPFWHAQINRALTCVSNMVTNTSLTDMETGYKVVRADILRELNLSSRSFTLEPEITCRLAQWGARIYERPISYNGRSYEEGKKIRARDGIKAIATLLNCRFRDRNYTQYREDAILRSMRHAHHYQRSLMAMAEPFLGQRLLDAGAGIGSLSSHLLRRERLVLADINPHFVRRLQQRFAGRSNVRIEQTDLTEREVLNLFGEEELDTIFAANIMQQLGPDFLVMRNFHKLLPSGGRFVSIVPIDERLHNSLDAAAAHERRYNLDHYCGLLERAGFEIAAVQPFNRIGSVGWWTQGLLGRRSFGSGTVMAFDRLWQAARHVDRFLPLPATSAMVVGVKE